MDMILIRHGQTGWNTQARTQGRTDIPLDDGGRVQARRIAERLRHRNLSAVYASPLQRAMETASILAAPHGLAVTPDSLMLERDFGVWEGEEFSVLANKYPELIRLWREDPVACTPENAETLDEVLLRCLRFLEELAARHRPDDTVAVVGHSVPLRLLIAHLIGLPLRHLHRLRIDNASYTELRLGEKYTTLTVLNDTGHLLEG